jgi:hypothetical protein
MALGFLATAATIPKLLSVKQHGFKGDATYFSSDILLWSLLEVNLGIIAACVPTLRGPFESALKRWGGTRVTQLAMKPMDPSFTPPGFYTSRYTMPQNDEDYLIEGDEKYPVEKTSWLDMSTDDLHQKPGG